MKYLRFCAFLALGLSACTSTRVGSLTLASTKNLGYTYTTLREHVAGQDCAYNVLGIPLGSVNPNLQEAVDNAASQVPGADMMTDVTVHHDVLITLLYNQACVRVDGNAINSASSARSPVFGSTSGFASSQTADNSSRVIHNPNVDQLRDLDE